MNALGVFLLVSSAVIATAFPRHRSGVYSSAQQQANPEIEIPTLPPIFRNAPGWLPGFGGPPPPFFPFNVTDVKMQIPESIPSLPFPPNFVANSQQLPSMPRFPPIAPFQNTGDNQHGGRKSPLPWPPEPGNVGDNQSWPGMRSPSPLFPLNFSQNIQKGETGFSWPPPLYPETNAGRNQNDIPGFGSPPPFQNGGGRGNERPNFMRSPPPFLRSTDNSSPASLSDIRSRPPLQFINSDGNNQNGQSKYEDGTSHRAQGDTEESGGNEQTWMAAGEQR